jgi:hypothetical protein
MKSDIYDVIKWVFSGIGVLAISFIINSTCSNGADIATEVSGNNEGTTITVGKNEGAINSTNNTAETIKHEEYKDSSRKVDIHSNRDTYYTEKGDIIQKPSYRDATIVRGDNGNPVGVTDNPSPIQDATELLGKLMRGEKVDIQEAVNATHPKFLINSGTEISVLESTGTGFAEFVKVKILEGAHKNETGWIHASTIQHEQRKK